MNSRANTSLSAPELADRRAWYAFGLWLRVAIVGMGMLVTGVALLLERMYAPTSGLVWLIGGGALAALAWHRARAALNRLNHAGVTADRIESDHNLRAGHHPQGTVPAALLGLSAAATALK
jgi:hypothetical protein